MRQWLTRVAVAQPLLKTITKFRDQNKHKKRPRLRSFRRVCFLDLRYDF